MSVRPVRLGVRNGHRFWQKGGGFDRNVRDDAEFSREVRYVHHNPVERALVTRPEDWTWSRQGGTDVAIVPHTRHPCLFDACHPCACTEHQAELSATPAGRSAAMGLVNGPSGSW